MKYTKLMNIKLGLLLVLMSSIFTAVQYSYGGTNCPNGINVAVSGDQYVEVGATTQYTCLGTPSGGTYAWTCSSGFTISAIEGTATAVAGITPSGDQWVKCLYTVEADECEDEMTVTIVKVEVTPNTMSVVESTSSGEFECKVTPSGLNPKYQWLTGSANGAWPSAAGNSPVLQYSAPNSKKTEVCATRWFAPTGSNDITKDGPECEYGIGVEITVGGITLTKSSAAQMEVTVEASGHCDEPKMVNQFGILTATNSVGVWEVVGQGTFASTAPNPWVRCAASSQFDGKFMAHENEHKDQFLNQTPWADLFNANSLYSSTLNSLTATTKILLNSKVWMEVENKKNADYVIMGQQMLNAERGAFAAQNAHPLHFLEYVNEADWRAEYGL